MSSKEQSTQSDLSGWAIVAIGMGIVIYTHQAEFVQATAIILGIAFVVLLIYGGFVWYRNRPKPLEPLSNKPLPPVGLDPLPHKLPEPDLQPSKPYIVHINHEEKQEHLLDSYVHNVAKLEQSDRSFLQRRGYEEREFVPLGKIRRERFLIKRQPPKSLEHTFVVHNIRDKVSAHIREVEITHGQDIAIFHKRKDYALCIVTPDDLRKHNYLSTKAKVLNTACGAHWWFVVTKSAYAKSFQRYGDVLTRNQLDKWIHTTFNPKTPSKQASRLPPL
jgi:hypothetical protein